LIDLPQLPVFNAKHQMKKIIHILACLAAMGAYGCGDCPWGNKVVKTDIEAYCANEFGEKNGKYVEYWKNPLEGGQIKRKGQFKNNKKHGKWAEWHENGKKKLGAEFVNGERHGKFTAWRENGKKKEEGELVNGKPQGMLTAWHPNG
jgi:antitoxin component YwqK of YwqJK toxin-antitoxin module